MTNFLIFFFTFSLIIFIHELGHYLASLAVGIPVKEFGFGFPPRMLKMFTWRGTEFTLNWLPIGGFVRPAGEDDANVPNGLANAPKLARIFVLAAGAGMNFLLAAILLTGAYMYGEPANRVLVSAVAAGSPAESAGLQPDDWIVAANGTEILRSSDLYATTQQFLGKPLTLKVDRNGTALQVELTPRLSPPEGQGAMGIEMQSVPMAARLGMSFPAALTQSLQTMRDLAWEVVSMPAKLIAGQIKPQEVQFVGIVGMKAMNDQVVEYAKSAGSLFPIVTQAALLNVAIGITNLLPLPALDGGRIMFVLLEAIRRKRIPAEREGVVHLAGMVVLLILTAVLVVQDVQRFYLP